MPNHENEDGILHADVTLDGHQVDASLTSSGVLQWRGLKSAGTIAFQEEAYGYRVGASTITLYAFQLVPRQCFSGPSLKKTDVHLDFSDDATHSEWATAVQSWFDASGRPKRLLVLVNPKGGKGHAIKIYNEVVSPIFVAAGIAINKQETKYLRHATDVARDLDLSTVDGIVCVSGDGIVVEVLNGLLQREDWLEAMKVPIGAIPAGSGNGLAKTVLDMVGEECNPSTAAFSIVKGKKLKVDVATVLQGAIRFHSLLNITWGIVSDVDIESEKYRWMGGFRLTFQSLVRIFGLRKYTGRIWYLPADSSSSSGRTTVGGSEKGPAVGSSSIGFPGAPLIPETERKGWREADGEFVFWWLQNVPWAAEDMKSHPIAQLSDGCLDLMMVRNVSKFQLLNLFLQMDSGLQLKSKHVEYIKVRALRMELGGRVGSNISGGYLSVDGEVLARGNGAAGNASTDLMTYTEPFEVSIQQGLATVFGAA